MWCGDGEWTARDRLLAMAFEIFQQSIDPACGHSRLLSADGEYDGHYRIHEWVCMACKAVDQDAEKRKKQKKADPKPGEKRSVWMKLFNPNGG